MPVAETAPAPASTLDIDQGGFDRSGGEIDEEIREVFLEEFQEEIGNLGQMLPEWAADPDNLERLRPIRRVFHTLKGSGRLVGAHLLGEFAWKVENMLNRVLDGSRAPTPAVQALLQRVADTLPQFDAALRGQAPVGADIDGLQVVADRLAAGEEALYAPAAAAAPAPQEIAAEAAGDAILAATAPAGFDLDAGEGTPASVDGVLREILEAEIAGHLKVIHAWLAAARAADPAAAAVDDDLVRAFHTSNGAFAMADVPEITGVTGRAEQYLKRLAGSGRSADAAGVDALEAAAAAIAATLAALARPQPRVPSFTALAQQLDDLRDALPAAGGLVSTVVGSGAGGYAGVAGASQDPEHGLELTGHSDLSRYIDLVERGADDGAVEAQPQEAEEAAAASAPVSEVAAGADLADNEATAGSEPGSESAPVLETAAGETLPTAATDADAAEVAAADAVVGIEPESESTLAADAARVMFEFRAAYLPVRKEADAEAPLHELADAVPAATATEAGPAVEATAAADSDSGIAADAAVAEPAAVESSQAPAEPSGLGESVATAVEPEFAAESQPEAQAGPEAQAAPEPEPEPEVAAAVAAGDAEPGAQTAEPASEPATAGIFEAAALAPTSFAAASAVDTGADPTSAEPAPAAADDLPSSPAEHGAAEAAVPAPAALADTFDPARFDLDLVDIFVEEANDLLDHSDGLLARLREEPEERSLVIGLQRDLHTIKGGARMAGIAAIGDLGHAIESLLEQVAEQGGALDGDVIRLLERGFDAMHGMLERTGAHREAAPRPELVDEFVARAGGVLLAEEPFAAPQAPGPEVAGDAETAPAQAPLRNAEAAPPEAALAGETSAPASAQAADAIPEAPARRAPEASAEDATVRAAGLPPLPDQPQPIPALPPLSAPVDLKDPAEDEGEAHPGLAGGQEQVRVRADLLDRLVNYAGEVAIYRARLEQQLGAFRGAMAELERTNVRLHDQLRRLDLETEAQIVARYQREQDARDATFDPLELDRFSNLQQLSRALAESAADISGLQGVLDDLARQYDLLLGQQSRVSSELQDGLMRARMVPFEGVVPRLRRTLRQAAQDTGKHAVLQLDGASGELDRNVLERMTAPLEHLLRNAVAHGLEKPDVRRAAGKPEEGVVTLALRREGSEMVLQVSDDGAGIDHAAIRRRAEARGMLQPGAQVDDLDLERLILEPGFSTAEEVSQLAGRGMGMDVVHNEVRQLGGTLEIRSVAGQGTRFVLRLPQTLAVSQAVFVQVGETQFAVPVAAIGGVGRISRERFDSADGKYVYAGEEYTLYDLGLLVGQGPTKAEGQAQVPLLLVRSGELRAAVAVDQVLGNREIVVKPVGPQIGSIPGIYGATITGDGRVVVILDAAPLVRRHLNLPTVAAAA
ncbi:MAG: Hpt domain-containing protein, partial [Pseudoxanthomonas sp.]